MKPSLCLSFQTSSSPAYSNPARSNEARSRLVSTPNRPFQTTLGVIAGLSLLILSAVIAVADEGPEPRFDSSLIQALEWRNIGPFRGGRATAVAGVPDRPHTYFFGSTGGGVWRTTDSGTTWNNVSDDHFETGSVGAIAVAPGDANVVWVGMGEAPVRGVMTTHGDGIYKSTDGGDTWQNVGLEQTFHISRIHIHPHDPETVWVAAQGHLWGPNPERGIYKSTDGGGTWQLVLHVDADTGASDLALDPTNPRVLYAAMWQHRRYPWQVESGGPGSGIWKSIDGGDNWEQLSKGLPELMGKIGVAVSPATPKRVWAIIEAEEGGLFRSDDAGKSWRRINEDRVLRARAWYYTHITADPQDPNIVYVLNAPVMKSIDGGMTFDRLPTPHGDNHALWIAPDDNQRMINANDGGGNVSINGGATWSTQGNQPTAQFYRVNVDNRFPYWVYGGQQDNSAIAIMSRSMSGGIEERHWHSIGGCESATPAFDPDDPRYIYGGCYQGLLDEYDMVTGQTRDIMAYPYLGLGSTPSEVRYRFNWNAPVVVSTHDPATIYHAGNHVLQSTDRGTSWQEISPDLTRDEENRQGPGGAPITNEGAGGEVYGTILALAASSHEAEVLWTGSDDGLVHVTRDGGEQWLDVTPPQVGHAMINAIDVSPHHPATAYLAVTRYKWDDLTPHIFKTSDYGATWTRHVEGIPDDTIVRVVREDPDRAGLLYAGTERGVFVSFDDGGAWQPLQLKLPVVPVTDLIVRHGDLIAATQGRAFWILDDLSPLHQMNDEVAAIEDLHLFAPRAAHRTGGGRGGRRTGGNAGTNPHNGVLFHYLLPAEEEATEGDETAPTEEEPAATEGEGEDLEEGGGESEEEIPPLELTIFDAAGNVVRTVSSEADEDDSDAETLDAKPGLNRFVWGLTRDPMVNVPEVLVFGSLDGYRVAPGTYEARLSRGDVSQSQAFEVLPDPRIPYDAAGFAAQQKLLDGIRTRIQTIHDSLARMRDTRTQVEAWVARLDDHEHAETIEEAGTTVTEAIDAWEDQLIQTKQTTFQDVINFPNRLNAELLSLMATVDTFEPIVNDGARERFHDLDALWQPQAEELQRILDQDLAAFTALFQEHAIPAIVVPVSELEDGK